VAARAGLRRRHRVGRFVAGRARKLQRFRVIVGKALGVGREGERSESHRKKNQGLFHLKKGRRGSLAFRPGGEIRFIPARWL